MLKRIVLALTILASSVGSIATLPIPAAAEDFANPAFKRVWDRTDALVAGRYVERSWIWGNAGQSVRERYYDSPGETRLVQYFDKSRMEINNPWGDFDSQWYVTNGLLAKEMIAGTIQTGDSYSTPAQPSQQPVAGDPPDVNPNAPTYASFRGVATLTCNPTCANPAPDRRGQRVTATIDKSGNVGDNQALGSDPETAIVYYDTNLSHNIPKAFWEFMNSSGPVVVGPNQIANDVIVNWVYAFGLPITEPYWVRAKVNGVERDVMVQIFERRSLTYTPSNPPGWRVEMGNIGQHYYRWRYGGDAQAQNAPPHVPIRGPHVGYAFSVHLYGVDRSRVYDLTRQAGFDWLKQQVVWADIERSPGQYDWGELDAIVNDTWNRGIHLILSVTKAPSFYTPNGGHGMPADPRDFFRFMQVMAARYNGKVDAYECWNEQNTAGETAGNIDPGAYVELLKWCYKGVKAGDPYAIVLYGGLTPTGVNDPSLAIDDVRFLEATYQYQNGVMKNYFDALAAHGNATLNPPETLWPSNPGPGTPDDPNAWRTDPSFYFRRIEQLRGVMERYSDGGKQIWITEFGWDSCQPYARYDGYRYCNYITEQQQADYLVRAFQWAKNNWPWIGVMAVWNLNFATIVPPTDEKFGWSILRSDWSPRPAYTALQNMPK